MATATDNNDRPNNQFRAKLKVRYLTNKTITPPGCEPYNPYEVREVEALRITRDRFEANRDRFRYTVYFETPENALMSSSGLTSAKLEPCLNKSFRPSDCQWDNDVSTFLVSHKKQNCLTMSDEANSITQDGARKARGCLKTTHALQSSDSC